MWIVLPTKDCKCASCERLREFVSEGGQLNLGRPDGLILNPGMQRAEVCAECFESWRRGAVGCARHPSVSVSGQ
jgi:hypothetical protein